MSRASVFLALLQLLLGSTSEAHAQSTPLSAVLRPGIAVETAQPSAAPQESAGPAWVLRINPAAPAAPLNPALLGQYDLDGTQFHLDQIGSLEPAMRAAGVSEWRVGLGRWEMGTRNLMPLGTGEGADADPCSSPWPWAYLPHATSYEELVRDRDWLVDRDGAPVTLADTLDDSRYSLDYVKSVIDCALRLGARPWVNIDLMPRALALNRKFRHGLPGQDECYSFNNGVSNSPPADPSVFAAAVVGVVKRIVEGTGLEAGRPVQYWEFWNEPEGFYAWDKSVPASWDRFFQTAVQTLAQLAAYRSRSTSRAVRALRFGMGSFAFADSAVRVLQAFDNAGGRVPMDFVSFHGYSDDPLDIVNGIRKVGAARAASRHYRHVELALAEWGRDLSPEKQSQPQAPMEAALHAATVIAMGAALGLTHAHRSILWDPFPHVGLGLLDHDGKPKAVATAYALLARVIRAGAIRLPIDGAPDGGLEYGRGACLVSRLGGHVRALLVNRNNEPRIAWIVTGYQPARPRTMVVLAGQGELSMARSREDGAFIVPARSVVLAEL